MNRKNHSTPIRPSVRPAVDVNGIPDWVAATLANHTTDQRMARDRLQVCADQRLREMIEAGHATAPETNDEYDAAMKDAIGSDPTLVAMAEYYARQIHGTPADLNLAREIEDEYQTIIRAHENGRD